MNSLLNSEGLIDVSFGDKLIRSYFNFVYNPVYDFTTGQLPCYRRLQEESISKLQFSDNDKVLCVGLGTGNEIFHIFKKHEQVSIVGIDYSEIALQKSRKKALRRGKNIEMAVMDARHLEFAPKSFDQVICLHVMDFVDDHEQATREMLRVLKDGGQFVITYPSEKEGAKLGANILRDSFRHNTRSRNFVVGLLAFLTQAAMGSVYLPLVLRQRKSYSDHQLHAMFTRLTVTDFQIEEYPAYQDFIVWGRK